MRRSTVMSFPLQLVFPDQSYKGLNAFNIRVGFVS
jgi:hypothetical protein